jgi:hypothetical protein
MVWILPQIGRLAYYMPGYHPKTLVTAKDAEDAKENQKRGENLWERR